MKKHLTTHILTILFIFFSTQIVQSGEEPRINLRPYYKQLSVAQVQEIPNISIRKKEVWGFHGHSTIDRDFHLKTINDDKVIVDSATGLMWHQSGSDKGMVWNEAKQWVKDLNSRGYAGYSDWRLPTVEEAASLLESNKKGDALYIDTVFDIMQSSIWTGDENDSASYLDGVWSIRFIGGYGGGSVCWCYENARNHVRPVRSMK